MIIPFLIHPAYIHHQLMADRYHKLSYAVDLSVLQFEYTFFHQITSKYLIASFIASTFSFGGCFLGCFNSSTALDASYFVNPRDRFTQYVL